MKLSIIIPCYNEEKNIPLILDRFSKVIDRDDIEVLLVDNGSEDNTQEVLKKLIQNYSFARTVKVEVNQGYGFGILAGLKQAEGEYLGWTHADMQTDPEDVIKALTIIEKEGCPLNVYVKGNRRNRPFFDEVFTIGMSIFESIYLGEKLHDINAQPNIFHKDFFYSWENPPYDFSLDLYALYIARKKKLNIIRFDVLFPKRIHGESSWNKGFLSKRKFIKRTIGFSRRLKRGLKA